MEKIRDANVFWPLSASTVKGTWFSSRNCWVVMSSDRNSLTMVRPSVVVTMIRWSPRVASATFPSSTSS